MGLIFCLDHCLDNGVHFSCNIPLWEDLVTKAQFSTAYIAHIIAESPGGARYDSVLSEKLKDDFSNLMLLCDAHHRLIDKEDIEGHPPARLIKMKQAHEARVQLQTSSTGERQSHVLHYGANIGALKSFVTFAQSREAMFPDYPSESRPIEINLQNSPFHDSDGNYWAIEQESLQRQFATKVRDRLGKDIAHISVFAIAPQPLLMVLGQLLSDVTGISVYQHQKEPHDNWKWCESTESFNYNIVRPTVHSETVALNLSLSATVDNTRITSVLGEDTSIWTITIARPYNDFLKSRTQLQAFRECFRKLLDEIKAVHGQQQVVHVFPAVPVSIAVEMGRVWMPKADLPLKVYDQNARLGGFIEALTISSSS